MYTIEVDFEVSKALMLRRPNENVSNNDVLRELLKLPPKAPPTTEKMAPSVDDWIVKGVNFPAGTDFRGKSKGRHYTARVEKGALNFNGKSYDSPSAAATVIAGHAINGWAFWEVRTPGGVWRPMASYRKAD